MNRRIIVTAKEQKPNWLASKLIGDELISKINNLNSQELSWLSGYCAGLLESSVDVGLATNTASASVPSPAQAPSSEPVKPALVLYASQTGNAQSVAEKLHATLESNAIHSVLKSTLDIKLKELKNYSAILVTASTHGEGEPPDDAIEFHEAVLGKKRPKLDGIKHAVLGLGDSSYEFFCQTAKDFDKAFSDGGSISLTEPTLCDVDYADQAKGWVNKVASLLKDYVSSLGGDSNVNVSANVIDIQTETETSVGDSAYTKNNPLKATVETIQRITGTGSPKETYHVEIDIADSGLVYEPGDSVGVLAHNREALVDEVIEVLSLEASDTITFKNISLPLKQYLIEHAELTLINRLTIKSLLELSPSDALSKIHEEDFSEFIDNNQFVDVLHVAKPTLSAQQLVDILKPIKPRLYSISSSLEESPDEVHLTLNHVASNTEHGQRYGLASHHLTQDLEEGDEVSIYIEKNQKFKLPLGEEPIIMVGPGTGLAPFRSFLQHREALENNGQNWLFFGNPYFNTDFLYQVEIQKYLKSGLLTHVDLAFSRDADSGEKVYVQHKLLEKSAQVWQWLEQGAYFYVCGDMHRMAKDVEEALLNIVQSHGGFDEEQAKQYLKQLKLDNRYQRDIY